LWQTGARIGSVIKLLGLDLAVPNHSTRGRRVKTLEVPLPRRLATGPLRLFVHSLGAAGRGQPSLADKHATSRRRSWRTLHNGVDTDNGEIVAVEVTRKDVDDAVVVDAFLGEIADPWSSLPPTAT
jgi:hypothetical protein